MKISRFIHFFYSAGNIPGNKLGLSWSTKGAERPFYAPISPAEQHKIDVKYDDGLPLSGNIIGDAGLIEGMDTKVQNNSTETCISGNAYLETPKNPGQEGCILILENG